MTIKNPPTPPKHHDGQNVHPETKQPRPAVGVPGSDSSESKQRSSDPRTVDDQDGNQQQIHRNVTKP